MKNETFGLIYCRSPTSKNPHGKIFLKSARKPEEYLSITLILKPKFETYGHMTQSVRRHVSVSPADDLMTS